MSTVKVVIGDWSDDGHGKVETYMIQMPGSYNAAECFALGAEMIGVDITEFCKNYEDNIIPGDKVRKFNDYLTKYGRDPVHFEQDDEDDYCVWADTYFEAWLQTVNIYLEAVGADHATEIRGEDTTVNIGGYGLFWN